MDKHITSCVRLLSFEQIYQESIRSKLETIDLFLKENTAPFQVYEVAHVLEIETDELTSIMEALQITEIDSVRFFTLVFNASSDICKLLARQWKHSQTDTYTPEMIAEIYNLNIHKVKNAFVDLSVDFVTNVELMDVFKRIHLPVFSA